MYLGEKMTSRSKIEWTEYTWNPITGCDKISDGCINCYAERMAKRLKAMGNERYKDGFKVSIHKDLFREPLKIKKPKIIFVCSMSDLFHERVKDEDIISIFKTMNCADQHIFQVLTKRPKRMLNLSNQLDFSSNIWVGVSVENNKYLDRIDILKKIPAKIKFISFEPLLDKINEFNTDKIDWVIVGGESGPKFRKMKEEWVIIIKNICEQKNIPFFFKQWGGFNKKKNGRKLRGKIYNSLPKKLR
jgi:protein gp37